MKRYQKAMAAAVCALFAAYGIWSVCEIRAVRPTMAEATTLPSILLDPGHGGIDGGAVGVNHIVEKDINLSICLIMRDLFQVSGFDVVMTRETDVSIHDEGITGVRKQKTSDLRNRLAIVGKHSNAVFISLHQNKYESGKSRGAQVFYGPKSTQSQKLAQIIQENFVEDLQPDNKRQIKEAGKNLYLMYHAECPSVLVECGFLSNNEDARQLIDPEYQAKVAFTVYRSVMEYLELDTPAVGEPNESAMALW